MEKEIIFLVDESPEGGHEARALGHSIFTQADTFDELKTMVQDAVVCHFESDEKPHIVRLHFVNESLGSMKRIRNPSRSDRLSS